MIGTVDFNKDMDFWQQDKWSGSFPVKWHILKDVPNTNFRHIILENNENKPVTNSRDTQEIKCKQGMDMLNIFKNYTLKTSLLDDFMYYEERQKIMQEEKARLLGKTYDRAFFIPAFIPPKKTDGLVDKHPSATADEKPTTHNDQTSSGKADSTDRQILSKPSSNPSSSGKDKVKSDVVEDANDVTSILKIGSLTIDPKQAEAKHTEEIDVVTVGSMSVKVNGFPKASKLDKPSPGT